MVKPKLHTRTLKGTHVKYYLYIPPKIKADLRIFITVHGWSRNALEHANGYLPFAATYGVVMVAPLFENDEFPQFQRLGHSARKGRADHTFDSIISEVSSETGAMGDRLYLFGFSGGGQFVHRYTMAYSNRVARVVLGAPGWYTFPDPTQPFPMGIGPGKRLPDIHPDPHRFLKVPTKIMIGELDIRRDHHLNTSRIIDRAQGTNRMERATRWVQAMNAAARGCNFRTRYKIDVLPNSEHSFTSCMENGGMGEKVFRFLFGKRP